MAVLSGVQVARLAFDVGVPNGQLVTCVAIAWAESGLRTDAVGYNPSSVDRGLWQINSYYHAEVSDACCFDPTCCAQAMFRISSGGTNWHPWSTYNNGLDPRIVTAANIAVNAMLATTAGPPAPGPASNPPGFNDPVKNTLDYIKFAGGNPLNATARMWQYLIDGAMDSRFGPGHGVGPVFGNTIT